MTGAFFPSGFNNVFYSKARSMARFGLLLLNKGKWNSTPVLTDSNYFDAMTNTSQTMNPSYGYLTWLNGKSSFLLPGTQFNFPGHLMPDAPADMFAALGKNGQLINVVPSSRMVVIRMGDTPNGAEVSTLFNDTLWIKLKQIMCQPNTLQSPGEEHFQFYPNPATDVLQVRTNQNGLFELYNLVGKRIIARSLESGVHRIDLVGIPNGHYQLIFKPTDHTKLRIAAQLNILHY